MLGCKLLNVWSVNQKHRQHQHQLGTRDTSSQSHPRPKKWGTLGRGANSLKSRFWQETCGSQVLGNPSESAVSWDRLKAEDPGCGVLGRQKRESRHMSPWDTCLSERDRAQSDKCRRRGGWGRSDGEALGRAKLLGNRWDCEPFFTASPLRTNSLVGLSRISLHIWITWPRNLDINWGPRGWVTDAVSCYTAKLLSAGCLGESTAWSSVFFFVLHYSVCWLHQAVAEWA